MNQTLIRIAESRGIADALEGVPPTACPYRSLALRTAWMCAYRVANPVWNARTVADEIGINRRRDGDLREMVRALGIHAWMNTSADNRRRTAAQWALRHWKAYQAECNARRSAR